jgi:quercetin dioxygenase-like cupin family protein
MDSIRGASDLDVESAQRHAERPGFRITELRMSPTQRVPWHCHTNVQDTFYVLEGRVRVTLREPSDQIDLAAGESWGPVRPGRPHLVTNLGTETATFLVLQGMGDYDFVTIPDREH